MPSEPSRGVGRGAARGDRVAIVAGLRTPFAKQQTAYRSLSAYELGCLVVRELCAGLPKSVEAFSVVRACATSFQAATSAAESILAGQHDVAIVGDAAVVLEVA